MRDGGLGTEEAVLIEPHVSEIAPDDQSVSSIIETATSERIGLPKFPSVTENQWIAELIQDMKSIGVYLI